MHSVSFRISVALTWDGSEPEVAGRTQAEIDVLPYQKVTKAMLHGDPDEGNDVSEVNHWKTHLCAVWHYLWFTYLPTAWPVMKSLFSLDMEEGQQGFANLDENEDVVHAAWTCCHRYMIVCLFPCNQNLPDTARKWKCFEALFPAVPEPAPPVQKREKDLSWLSFIEYS